MEKKKLKIDKHLPKIVLPNKKLKMFENWWNEDIRFEKTVPHSFEEGYLIIEYNHGNQTVDKFKDLIKLTAKTYNTTYRNIEMKLIEFLNTLNDITLYFKFIDKNRIFVEIYDKNNYLISNANCEIGETSEEEPKISSENLFLDCKNLENINHVFGMNLIYYLITCLWYIATTAKNTKYIYEEKTPMITNRKKGVVQVSDTKYIRTPVYDMSKIKTVRIDKLITRKKGWTYSHAFQVHGHYRHYKDGKVIFIESYIKGKGKPFKAQTTILEPERIKEV